jgi:hypothetical protein
VRNLPNRPIKVISQGVSSFDIPPQGASSSSKPVEGGDLQHVASKVGRLHLAKTRLSGNAGRKLKKARERQSGTGGLQQPGHLSLPKSGDPRPRYLKDPGLRAVPQQKRSTLPKGPGTLRNQRPIERL